MLKTRNNLTKTRIAASVALVFATLSIGLTNQAAASAVPLAIAVVQQQSGHTTAVYFDNHTNQNLAVGLTGYPASVGDSVTVSFDGVTKNDGSPAATDTIAGDAGYLATFCGNYTDTGVPSNDRALTSADISTLEGITAHCAAFVPATSAPGASPAGPTISANLTLNLQGYKPAVAAVPDSGVHGVAAVAAVAGAPEIPCVPATDVQATLFSQFVAACSISPAVPAIATVTAVDAVADTFVAGSPAVAATPGTKCVAEDTVIPCLILVASTDQSVALAMPAINVAAVSVFGRIGLYDPATGTGVCNPASVSGPPSTCPAVRLSSTATPYPFVVGGSGFLPSSNSLALVSAVNGGADIPVVGDSYTAVSEKICATADNSNCLAAVNDFDPASPAHVDLAGNIGGVFTISDVGGVTTGDKFLQVTGQYYLYTGDVCPAAFTTFATGICSITQTHYASIKILTAPTPPVFSPSSGAPGTVGSITGSGYEPRANVAIQRRDVNGNAFGTPMTSAVDGVGNLNFAFPAGALDYPVVDIVLTVIDAAYGAATYTSPPVAFDSAAAIAFCSATDTCNAGQLITTAVLPGTVQLFSGDAVVDIEPVDLSTIDITDPESWYPLSAPGPMTSVIIGDMRGANTGFVVTGSVADLRGATQSSNTIPAADVFVADGSIVCDIYADAGEGNEPLGVVSVGVTADPQADIPGASPLADGSQEFCTLLPDATGRAAGMFQLDAALQIAGRPITAVDDYTGMLVITITGN